MNICEHLTATAKLLPDHEALVFEERSYRYADLNRLSASAAEQLAEAGVLRGDRVAIMLPNAPSFVVWYYAALRIGAIAVSVSTRLAPKEVAFVCSDCEAKAFIGDQPTLDNLAAQLPSEVAIRFAADDLGETCNGDSLSDPKEPGKWIDAQPHDPALILYTSGTTGFAKGATLSHMNVRSNVHAFNHLCNMQSRDRILLAVPLFHCFGQNALLNSALNIGATLVLQRKFDPVESKRLIAEQKVTQLYGVPTMFQLLHQSCTPDEIASIGYCFSAATTLPIQVAERWREKFKMPIHEGYGLTETSPFASYNHRYHFVPGSIGTPIDCVEMKIVDTETGEDCPPGEFGEIAIRGPNVMLGYWNRPADTEAAIRNGWFHSGDIGRVDENGFYYIVDRVKDMISVGGLKVFPAEVERVLLDHPSVAEAAIVGAPDEMFGEQVVAFIVKAEDAELSAAELAEYARENVANYKAPRRVAFIDQLPRNPSGKILKTKLREMTSDANRAGSPDNAENRFDAAANVQIEPTLRKKLASTHAANRIRVANAFVQDLVKSVSGIEETPDVESRLLDLGLDSLMIVEMSHRIQVELGSEVETPAAIVFEYPRICDLAKFLAAELEPPSVSEPSDKPQVDDQSAATLRESIAAMSDDEVLAELKKELDG